MKHNNMLAMILAGGRGSRLHELTNKVAKPAVSYGGKYRIVDFPLSNCANSGIDVVGVLTQYESILLNSYVLQVAAGDLTQKKAVSMYCLLARKQTPIWMFTAVLPMRFHRTLISSTHTIRNMYLFFPAITFIR